MPGKRGEREPIDRGPRGPGPAGPGPAPTPTPVVGPQPVDPTPVSPTPVGPGPAPAPTPPPPQPVAPPPIPAGGQPAASAVTPSIRPGTAASENLRAARGARIGGFNPHNLAEGAGGGGLADILRALSGAQSSLFAPAGAVGQSVQPRFEEDQRILGIISALGGR